MEDDVLFTIRRVSVDEGLAAAGVIITKRGFATGMVMIRQTSTRVKHYRVNRSSKDGKTRWRWGTLAYAEVLVFKDGGTSVSFITEESIAVSG